MLKDIIVILSPEIITSNYIQPDIFKSFRAAMFGKSDRERQVHFFDITMWKKNLQNIE